MSEKDYGVPQPPEHQRNWAFPLPQKVGIPLLFLIPILALLGVFGNSMATVRQQGQALALETTFPVRLRYKMAAPLVVRATNISAQTIPTVTVKFDRDYLFAFSGVTFQPAVDEINEEDYEVHLSQLAPGETRVIALELKAEEYWQQEGTVSAAAGAADAPPDVTVDVHSFLIP